jgi:hypothetical protein
VSGAVISRLQLAAAHDGDAELVVVLRYENGGETLVALDEFAARHLLDACGTESPDALVGQGWERVRDALDASSNRFVAASGGAS